MRGREILAVVLFLAVAMTAPPPAWGGGYNSPSGGSSSSTTFEAPYVRELKNWKHSVPPDPPGTYDDEFDSYPADDISANWTEPVTGFNFDIDTTTYPGFLVVHNSDGAGNRRIVKTVDFSGDFDARIHINPYHQHHAHKYGLIITDASGTGVILHVNGGNTSQPVYASVYGAWFLSTAKGNVSTYTREPIALRVARSGTTLYYYYSADGGRIWSQVYTETDSTSYARMGIHWNFVSSGDTFEPPKFWVDHVRTQ